MCIYDDVVYVVVVGEIDDGVGWVGGFEDMES